MKTKTNLPKLIFAIAILFLVSSCKNRVDELVRNGDNAFLKANFEQAQYYYQEALKINYTNPKIHLKLASSQLCLTKDSQPIYITLSAFTNLKMGINYNFRKTGTSYFAENPKPKDLMKISDEIGMFTEAINLNKSNKVLYLGRGMWYNHIGEFEKGYLDFTKAIQLDSTFVEAYIQRGNSRKERAEIFWHNALISKNDFNRIKDFSFALKLQPQNHQLLRAQVSTLFRIGQKEVAINMLNKELTKNPLSILLLQERAFLRSITGDTNGSISDYEYMNKIDPSDPNYLLSLANLSLVKGNKDKAIEYLQKAELLEVNEFQRKQISNMILRSMSQN